jgi:hypothetical protein
LHHRRRWGADEAFLNFRRVRRRLKTGFSRGDRTQAEYPVLSLALFANGSEVTVSGDMQAQCIQSFLKSEEETFYTSAPTAPDGSFHLIVKEVDIPISISGVVPADGAATWDGIYFVGSSGACTVNATSTFTASTLHPYDGAYAGTIFRPSNATSLNSMGISIDFSQDLNSASSIVNGSPAYYIPLNVIVDAANSPCFSHGISIPGIASSISGEFFSNMVSMDDGAQLSILGTFSNPAGASISVVTAISGGACDKYQYSGTLTRQ